MDIYNMYLGDCVSYSSMRNPIYRDYEKYPYGSMESSKNSQKNNYNSGQGKNVNNKAMNKQKTTKQTCPFCQEQKKRPLGAYLRKREIAKRNDSIMEEEDDDHHDHEHDDEEKK